MAIVFHCLIILISILLSEIVARNVYPIHDEEPIRRVKLNHTLLMTWYDEVATCMIENTGNQSYWQYLKSCHENSSTKARYNDGFFTLPSSAYNNKVRGCCCSEDMPVREREFDYVMEGMEDGNQKPMLRLLTALSATNRSMVLLGDSMNSQFFHAMIQEIKRETSLGILEGNTIVASRWWHQDGIYQKMGMTGKSLTYFLDSYKWTPPEFDEDGNVLKYNGKQANNPVYFYNLNLYYFQPNLAEEVILAEIIMPLLNTQDHPDGLVVFANIGHHLEHERTEGPLYRGMIKRIGSILSWLHELSLNNPKSIVAFRETTPAHFNAPSLEGTYEEWKYSSNAHYDYTQPNNFDSSMYYCRQIYNLSKPDAYLLRENLVARQILNAWGKNQLDESRVSILHIEKYLAPFARLKYGHCGGWTRIPVIDCVHYCSNAPPMWAPIWHEMLEKVENFQIFQKTLENSTSNSFTGKILLLRGSDPREYYFFNRGIIQKAPDLYSIEKYLNRKDLIIEDCSKEYLDEIPRIEDIPVTLLEEEHEDYPDGTLVKGARDREIFLVQNGMRRGIPSWDTFVNMKFSLSQVKIMPNEDVFRIPLGEPMPLIN